MILHPRIPHTREKLADTLWPDAPPGRVRRNLSDLVYRLQKIVGTGWLTVDSHTIAFQPEPGVQVDVWDFDNWVHSKDAVELQKAIDLYVDDLLPEIYDDWIHTERELRRGQYASALETLSALYEAQGKLQPALLYARRLILAEPLHEPAHQSYLRLLGRLRRFGEASAHYAYLCRLMRTGNFSPWQEK